LIINKLTLKSLQNHHNAGRWNFSKMELDILAEKENVICEMVSNLYRIKSDDDSEIFNSIYNQYKSIHLQYSELSKNNLEALKRGLFIQWYQKIEPNFLSGISDLEQDAEKQIVDNLFTVINTKQVDSELIWMLNYYNTWDWVFLSYENFRGFDSDLVNEANNRLPENIDKKLMLKRGQMGKYWLSLTKYSNTE
jgi:hypothetical protein